MLSSVWTTDDRDGESLGGGGELGILALGVTVWNCVGGQGSASPGLGNIKGHKIQADLADVVAIPANLKAKIMGQMPLGKS